MYMTATVSSDSSPGRYCYSTQASTKCVIDFVCTPPRADVFPSSINVLISILFVVYVVAVFWTLSRVESPFRCRVVASSSLTFVRETPGLWERQ